MLITEDGYIEDDRDIAVANNDYDVISSDIIIVVIIIIIINIIILSLPASFSLSFINDIIIIIFSLSYHHCHYYIIIMWKRTKGCFIPPLKLRYGLVITSNIFIYMT